MFERSDFYVDEQIGRADWTLPRPHYHRVQHLPPHIDHKTSMQWFLSPLPSRGEPHAGPFMADLDAHVAGLTLDHVCAETIRLVSYLHNRWAVEPQQLRLWFSAGSGIHLALPASLFGTPVSAHLTSAFKIWARRIKDRLGLFTLDAPTEHQTLAWWEPHLVRLVGQVPASLYDPTTFKKRVTGNSLYAVRRLFRCEGVRHPRTHLYKTRLSLGDVQRGEAHLRALAQRRSLNGPEPDPSAHLPLVVYLQALLEQLEEATKRREQGPAHARLDHQRSEQALRPAPLIPPAAPAPVCMQRLLTSTPPEGNTNNARITLATYWRSKGIDEATAIALLRQWLLQSPCTREKAREREDSAHSTVHTVYRYPRRYRFAVDYIIALGVIAPEECDPCPLRKQCWTTTRADPGEPDNDNRSY